MNSKSLKAHPSTKTLPSSSDDSIHSSTKLTKLDILIINNGWNDNNERLTTGIGYNAGIYKELHEKAAAKYQLFDKVINFSIIILSVFLSTNAIIDLVNDINTGSYLKKIVVFIVTLLTVSNNFLKYKELALRHKSSASKFNKIYNDIRSTLTIYKKDRYNAVKYIQSIMKQYDQLEVNSPEIPNGLLNAMDKKIKLSQNRDLQMPNDRTRQIEVVVDHPNDILVNNPSNNFKINNKQNIREIRHEFGVDGDMSEHDNITKNDIRQARNTASKRSQYEYERMLNMRTDSI